MYIVILTPKSNLSWYMVLLVSYQSQMSSHLLLMFLYLVFVKGDHECGVFKGYTLECGPAVH